MGSTDNPLDADILEVARAINRIRDRILYKRGQLTKGLGRLPDAEELLSVCDTELGVMSQLHTALERLEYGLVPRVPDSLLGHIFLKKFMAGKNE